MQTNDNTKNTSILTIKKLEPLLSDTQNESIKVQKHVEITHANMGGCMRIDPSIIESISAAIHKPREESIENVLKDKKRGREDVKEDVLVDQKKPKNTQDIKRVPARINARVVVDLTDAEDQDNTKEDVPETARAIHERKKSLLNGSKTSIALTYQQSKSESILVNPSNQGKYDGGRSHTSNDKISCNGMFMAHLRRIPNISSKKVMFLDTPALYTSKLLSKMISKERMIVPQRDPDQYQEMKFNSYCTVFEGDARALFHNRKGLSRNEKFAGMWLDFEGTLRTHLPDIRLPFELDLLDKKCLLGVTVCQRGEKNTKEKLKRKIKEIATEHSYDFKLEDEHSYIGAMLFALFSFTKKISPSDIIELE